MRRREHSYFWTLLRRSLLQRKSRVLVSMLAVALGTSVVGAFVIFYADVNAKMSRELRAYGANFVVKPRTEAVPLRDAALARLRETIPGRRLVGAQPFLYGIVSIADERAAAAGIHFDSIGLTTPYWQVVSGAIPRHSRGDCLLGRDVAGRLRIEPGERVELKHGDRAHPCTVAAIIETGGAEDDQVFVPIDAARTLFGRPGEIDLVLASIVADAAEAERFARAIEQGVPGSDAQPIRKLSRSEGAVLATIRSIVYVVVGFIILSMFVSLLISLMASLSERRKEVALMKALGATRRTLRLHFLAEVAVTGVGGGLVGLWGGLQMASFMEQTIFGTAVTFHWWLSLPVLAAALGVSLAGAAIPLKTVSAIQPAIVLKGE